MNSIRMNRIEYSFITECNENVEGNLMTVARHGVGLFGQSSLGLITPHVIGYKNFSAYVSISLSKYC